MQQGRTTGNRDGRAEVRNAVQKVGSAIQRIDHPSELRTILGGLSFAAFFAEDGVVRIDL